MPNLQDWKEPDIIINGKELTFAQCMTVRVAITSFLMFVSDYDNAKELGKIANGYEELLINIINIMHVNTIPISKVEM